MEDCGSTSDGTDQESEGTIIATAAGITDCPANALMTWLGAAGITKAGTISRVRLTDRSVANVVKTPHGIRCPTLPFAQLEASLHQRLPMGHPSSR